MQLHHSDLDRLIANSVEADVFAREESDPRAKENWQKIAASWRLLAERLVAERTGGEVLLH